MRILEKTLQRGMLGETFRGETVRRTKKDDFQDIEIRLSERSEFPYFPISRRFLS